jgi:hypothetical protein
LSKLIQKKFLSKSSQKTWAAFVIYFQTTALSKQFPYGRNFAQSGHPALRGFFSSIKVAKKITVQNFSYLGRTKFSLSSRLGKLSWACTNLVRIIFVRRKTFRATTI